MKVGVLLSGCGVYDGTEIHEAVLTLLALEKAGAETICIAPDIDQYHVVNHLTGEEMPEKRNVLVESARIARGKITPLDQVNIEELDALAMPGGFGTAKNFTNWAFKGAESQIHEGVKQLIREMIHENKPIAAVCMSPTTLAKALEGTGIKAVLTVGNTDKASHYDIAGISKAMESIGAKVLMCDNEDVIEDDINNIVTSPCYMMDVSIVEVYKGIQKTVSKLVEMVVLQNESDGE
ncbi:isoprenoid biosynthesis glyoxalase ElbB [Thermoflexibacter ruber]|uniref:Enhancing lycopene biosynthesis protein 2 n=1 Tax=Thermoflexibacter ruber TaxID=1003 RepID=A0A1I2CNS6_9BACT|nr:isoprenoid biosynthesis glyoxalase ElbB [Thermoflexibacter ruber]SFE69390.1 Enhancing lycopene biosynthesis protein 2 [Thermoflexibacter ruber]